MKHFSFGFPLEKAMQKGDTNSTSTQESTENLSKAWI
jgi:hypothetical protein